MVEIISSSIFTCYNFVFAINKVKCNLLFAFYTKHQLLWRIFWRLKISTWRSSSDGGWAFWEPSLTWALNWKPGWSPILALNWHLDKSPLWDSDSLSAQQWPETAQAFASMPQMGVFPRASALTVRCSDSLSRLWEKIIWAVWTLAAEAVGVRILRGESRSVGHPRTALYGVESPCLLEQPELQRPGKGHGLTGKVQRAQHGIMGTAEHYGYKIAWAQLSIVGTTSWAQPSIMDTTLLSSAFLRILTDTSGACLKKKKNNLKRE